MYESFFGFFEKPFSTTPNIHYLYPSTQHEGVIRILEHGIDERKGFLLLVGEVGTGKTTSIRELLRRLGDQVQTSVIFNPLVSTLELLKTINKDFGCEPLGESIHDQLETLNAFLLKNDSQGRTAVVVIDEAQNLSFETMEMARLLSNLETNTHKLLQILLVGQPELEEKLSEKSLRQIAQRIQIYCKLFPLSFSETCHYVAFRLQKAGSSPLLAFEPVALRELYKISGGIPRIINTICELALMSAYAQDTRVITKHMIKESAREAPIHVHYS